MVSVEYGPSFSGNTLTPGTNVGRQIAKIYDAKPALSGRPLGSLTHLEKERYDLPPEAVDARIASKISLAPRKNAASCFSIGDKSLLPLNRSRPVGRDRLFLKLRMSPQPPP